MGTLVFLVCGGGTAGDVDPQKTIQVSGLGPAQVVTGRQFERALERPVVDFHDEKACRWERGTRPGTVPADAQAVALDRDFQVVVASPASSTLTTRPLSVT